MRTGLGHGPSCVGGDTSHLTGLEGPPAQSGWQRRHEKPGVFTAPCGRHQPGLWSQTDPHEGWIVRRKLTRRCDEL